MAKNYNKNNGQPAPKEFGGEQVAEEVLGRSFDDFARDKAGTSAKQPAVDAERKNIDARFKPAKGTLDKVVAAARAATERDNATTGRKWNCDTLADVETWLPGSEFAATIGKELVEPGRALTNDEQLFFEAMEARAVAMDAEADGDAVNLYEYDNSQAEYDTARMEATDALIRQKTNEVANAKSAGEKARRQAELDNLNIYLDSFANPATAIPNVEDAAYQFMSDIRSGVPSPAIDALRDEMMAQAERDRSFADCDAQVRQVMRAQLEAQRSTERADVDEAVAAAQAALAKEYAKRQGKSLFGAGEGLTDEFKDAQTEYNDAVRASLALDIRTRERTGESVSDQDKIMMIALGTAEQSNNLQGAIAEQAKDVNPRRAKFYNFMAGLKEDGSKEDRKSKIWMRRAVKYGVGAGIVAATGGLGTGIAIGAWVGVNSYMSKEAAARNEWLQDTSGKVDEDALAKQLHAEAKSLSSTGSALEDDLLDAGTKAFNKSHEKDTTKKQNQRTKRMGVAALKGVAVGGAIAIAPVVASEVAERAGEAAQHAWDSFYQNVHGVPNPSSPYTGVESMDTISNFSPTMPNLDTLSNIHVDYNGGLFETFHDMGLQGDYTSIMNQVGPELVARGDAYVMPSGDYGWVRPGYLSQEALNIIQRARGY